ncbi:unnamed protein product, partial [Ixodes persulcatus]
MRTCRKSSCFEWMYVAYRKLRLHTDDEYGAKTLCTRKCDQCLGTSLGMQGFTTLAGVRWVIPPHRYGRFISVPKKAGEIGDGLFVLHALCINGVVQQFFYLS